MAKLAKETSSNHDVQLPETITLYRIDGTLIHSLPAAGNDLASVFTDAVKKGISLRMVVLENEPAKENNSQLYINLKGLDLQGIDLGKSILSNVSFRDSDLAGAKFDLAKLDGAVFDKAKLCEASFEESVIKFSSFDSAILTESNFHRASINKSQFNNSQAERIYLEDASITESSFYQANMKGAQLSEARLQGNHFSSADFTNATFNGTEMENCHLSLASLKDARLTHAEIKNCNFEDTNVDGANFKGAKLDQCTFAAKKHPIDEVINGFDYGVHFVEAEKPLGESISIFDSKGKVLHTLVVNDNTTEKVLVDAHQRNISLAGAKLEGLQLGFNNLQGIDLSNGNIKDCDFRAAKLGGSNFSGAAISGTCFYGANVEKATFDLATITKTEFCHANIDDASFKAARLNNCQLNDEYSNNAVPATAIVNGVDIAELMNPINRLDAHKFKEDCFVARKAHIDAADAIFSVKKERFSPEEIIRMSRGQFSDIKMVDLEQANGQYRDEPCRLGVGISGEFTVQLRINNPINITQDTQYQLTPKENDLLSQGRAIFISAAYVANGTLETPMQWMQIDAELNRVVTLKKNELTLPEKLLGKDIKAHHQELKETGAAQVGGLQAKNGKTFSALVEVDLTRGKLNITPDLSLSKSRVQEATLSQTEGKAIWPHIENSTPALILQVPEDEPAKALKSSRPKR